MITPELMVAYHQITAKVGPTRSMPTWHTTEPSVSLASMILTERDMITHHRLALVVGCHLQASLRRCARTALTGIFGQRKRAPYTTFIAQYRQQRMRASLVGSMKFSGEIKTTIWHSTNPAQRVIPRLVTFSTLPRHQPQISTRDRKSTRLNS